MLLLSAGGEKQNTYLQGQSFFSLSPESKWTVCIGVPYGAHGAHGAHIWQVGDSSKQNGAKLFMDQIICMPRSK